MQHVKRDKTAGRAVGIIRPASYRFTGIFIHIGLNHGSAAARNRMPSYHTTADLRALAHNDGNG